MSDQKADSYLGMIFMCGGIVAVLSLAGIAYSNLRMLDIAEEKSRRQEEANQVNNYEIEVRQNCFLGVCDGVDVEAEAQQERERRR